MMLKETEKSGFLNFHDNGKCRLNTRLRIIPFKVGKFLGGLLHIIYMNMCNICIHYTYT